MSFSMSYSFTEAERELLKRLLLCKIAEYDGRIATGRPTPWLARRTTAISIYATLCQSCELTTRDGGIMVLHEIAKECCYLPFVESLQDLSRYLDKYPIAMALALKEAPDGPNYLFDKIGKIPTEENISSMNHFN